MSTIEEMELDTDLRDPHHLGCRAFLEFTIQHDEHGSYAELESVKYVWHDGDIKRKYRPGFPETQWLQYIDFANEYIEENIR